MGRKNGKIYDVVIVGAGLFGATCACELTRKGFRCLVVEKRNHIGGNCYTENRDGINIHQYGAHIFHTTKPHVWKWINQFATFNNYCHRLQANHEGRIFSFPINLKTFRQLWGTATAAEAQSRMEESKAQAAEQDSLENWALQHLGREIYEIFIKGYSEKQWGRHPSDLPSSIIKRVPIRWTEDDRYFDTPHQGIPQGGYAQIFQKLLNGSEVWLDTDFFDDRSCFESLAQHILYTGAIDRLFDYRFGELAYRGLRFELERLPCRDFQGIAVMNYTSSQVPFTRIIEHKHFEFSKTPLTWITREYSQTVNQSKEPFYPVRDQESLRKLLKYQEYANQFTQYSFGGRLGEYQYYDMDQIIESALKLCPKIESKLQQRLSMGTLAPSHHNHYSAGVI